MKNKKIQQSICLCLSLFYFYWGDHDDILASESTFFVSDDNQIATDDQRNGNNENGTYNNELEKFRIFLALF